MKSKTKTKNEPWKPAQGPILAGLNASVDTFNQQQPDLNRFGGLQREAYGRIAPGAEQGIMGAQGLVNRNLSGANLTGNPHLSGMLDRTRESVIGNVNDQFGMAGRFGSGMHGAILGREIAAAENQMRYGDYAQERNYQQDAIGQAQSLMGGSQGLLNNAAELPWIGVGALNGNVRQASNGYGTTTQAQKQPWGQMLLGAAANAGQAFAASDRRLKANIVKVGEEADGLGIYDFDYRQDMGVVLSPQRQRGVMADEVAILRPHALGPVINGGYLTVRYSELGL